MDKPTTPFPISGYYGPAYFCDREAETQQLINNLESGQSTVLAAIRRMGKTGLIKHLGHHLPKKWKLVYVDILFTENRSQLLNSLINGVALAIPEKQSIGKKVWTFLKSLRPVISYDSLTGQPQLSINLQAEASAQGLNNLFQMLETLPNPIVIAIDEFQQILHYPEANNDAWLRSIIQPLKNVHFIYSGSQQHLMNEIFTNPSRPFYRSTSFLNLERIEKPVYADFIQQTLKKHGRQMEQEALNELLDFTRLHTYYVQLLMSRCFIRKEKKLSTASWKEEAAKLLVEQQHIFFGYRDMLSKGQWKLLKAIAAEGFVEEPTASHFLQKHALGSSASVLRALAALQKKEMIYYNFSPQGKKYYGVYDLLFERWIQKNVMF